MDDEAMHGWLSVESSGGVNWLIPTSEASEEEHDVAAPDESTEPSWLTDAASIVNDVTPQQDFTTAEIPTDAARFSILLDGVELVKHGSLQTLRRWTAKPQLQVVWKPVMLILLACLIVGLRLRSHGTLNNVVAVCTSTVAACPAVALPIDDCHQVVQLRAALREAEGEKIELLQEARAAVGAADEARRTERAGWRKRLSEQEAKTAALTSSLVEQNSLIDELRTQLSTARQSESSGEKARRAEREGWRWRLLHDQQDTIDRQQRTIQKQQTEMRQLRAAAHAVSDRLQAQSETILKLERQLARKDRHARSHRAMPNTGKDQYHWGSKCDWWRDLQDPLTLMSELTGYRMRRGNGCAWA